MAETISTAELFGRSPTMNVVSSAELFGNKQQDPYDYDLTSALPELEQGGALGSIAASMASLVPAGLAGLSKLRLETKEEFNIPGEPGIYSQIVSYDSLKNASDTVAKISSIPMEVLSSGEQYAADKAMIPVQLATNAAEFYGDKVAEITGDESLGAVVKTAAEYAFFFGLPELFKSFKAIRTKAQAEAAILETRNKVRQFQIEQDRANKTGTPLIRPSEVYVKSKTPEAPKTTLQPGEPPLPEPEVPLRPDQLAKSRPPEPVPERPMSLIKPDTTPVKSTRALTVEERLGKRAKGDVISTKELFEKPEPTPAPAPETPTAEKVAVEYKTGIPERLRGAIEMMKEEISQGSVERSGGEYGNIVGSTYPDWFRGKGWSAKEFETILRKVELGQKLTDKQFDKYFEFYKIAEELNKTHPDLIKEIEIAEIEKRGFKPIARKMNAGDLEVGDRVLVKGEEFEHKGYDKEGRVILEDGVPIKADPWDSIEIEGIKESDVPFRSSIRPVSEILNDVNTTLGERGEIGGKAKTQAQTEAMARLAEDAKAMKELADKSGQELAEFLKDNKFTPAQIQLITDQLPKKEQPKPFEPQKKQEPIVKGETLEEKTTSLLDAPKTWFQELKDAYTTLAKPSSVKDIVGEYTGNMQILDQQLTKLGREIKASIPADRQEAITNYMQAGGNEALLRERAASTKGKLQKGYKDAIELTEAERASAKDFRTKLDDIIQEAIDNDVVDSYVENYVRGEWVRPDRAAKGLISQINSGYFSTRPREALHKVFQSYFDGEQAGFIPKDKGIGRQLIANIRSLKQAIEAKKAILNLTKSIEADGRKSVSVSGGQLLSKEVAEATARKGSFIKPTMKPGDVADYRYIDHPALRKWKYVGEDTAGKPIMLEGRMMVHPDAYGRINALLGASKIRSYTIPKNVPIIGGRKPGAAMLDAGAFIKGTILLGPFHQFHVGEHALFHKVNPFGAREIDFASRPMLVEGVKKGLMLFNHNALAEFGEGLASGGLLHKIPKAGEYLTKYQEWLFQDYIPRLKAEMFEKAVERATEHYAKDLESGKISMDQLIENSANQANAAFGEMNYKYMGRSKTFQDALRIGLLAPDFLEARLRFSGQALKPYGREQAAALIRGAAMMATTAQIINFTIGDKKFHWDRPFSFFIGGREYTPRSVVGDIFHLIKDPRSFAYHRLNPLWGKPLMEVATKSDFQGRKMTYEEVGKDVLQSWIPIPAQGIVKGKMGDTPAESITNALFQSVGLSNYQYRTDFERFAIQRERPITISRALSDKAKFKRELADELRSRNPNAMKHISEAIKYGRINKSDRETIVKNSRKNPVVLMVNSMTIDELAEGIDEATSEERRIILPIYAKKLNNKLKDIDAETYRKHIEIIKNARKKK